MLLKAFALTTALFAITSGFAIEQEAYLKASNTDPDDRLALDYFGRSLPISTNTLVVGAPGERSAFLERLVGSIRRECLDRVIVLNERQLGRTLESYFKYYHQVRPHRSLSHDSPIPRPVESPDRGKVMEMPQVGGLHHQYLRQAA